jgi:hypothetical protein
VRHPFHPSLRVPEAFLDLRTYLRADFDPVNGEVCEHAWLKVGGFFCGDLTALLLDPDWPNAEGQHIELGYHHQPVEIVPFCRNWGGGLHYGWAVLAPELDLDDQVCVSFAPGDGSACWLGDTTKHALENLLVGCLATWTQREKLNGRPSPAEDPRWQALCAALDLRPAIWSPDITPGARSPRSIQPVVPPGWRYQRSNDGIGVLADESAFAPEPADLANWRHRDERVDHARRLVAAGYPASAVHVLKYEFPERDDMLVMRDAYQALGRDLHVERADIWLSYHPS